MLSYSVFTKTAALVISIAFSMLSFAQNNADSLYKKTEALAKSDFNKALYICDSVNNSKAASPDVKAMFTRLKGLAFYINGSFDTAANYLIKAIDAFKNTGNQKELGLTLIEQAKLHRKLKWYSSALTYYGQAEKIFAALNDKDNLATVLNESGVVYEKMDAIDEAIVLYKRSLAIREELNDTTGMAWSEYFIGNAQALQKRFEEGLSHLEKSITLFTARNDNFGKSLVLTDMGVAYSLKGDQPTAIKMLNNSLQIAKQIDYKDLQWNIYFYLSEAYSKLNRYDSALYFQKRGSQIKDSLFTENSQKTIAELNVKYETAEKDKSILQQQNEIGRKNLFLTTGAALLLLLILTSVYYYRNQKLRNERSFQQAMMLQQEKAATAIINAEENERRKMASTLHDNLGQILSAVKMYISTFEDHFSKEDEEAEALQHKTMGLVDTAVKEVRNVSRQLMPEAIMKEGLPKAISNMVAQMEAGHIRFETEMDASLAGIDANKQLSAFRLVQEAVNNAIKHSGADKIIITGQNINKEVFLKVTDNGDGFEAHQNGELKGIGLQNLQSRVQFLKGNMKIDSAPGKGTELQFSFPVA